jgi:hypothetical protein
MNVARGVMLTFDYQFLANPAHNADGGLVSVFSGRVDAEFQAIWPEARHLYCWLRETISR